VNPAILPDLDAAVHWLRVDVEQDPIGCQAAVYLPQGVDHALQGYASQGVGEDRRVKRVDRELRSGDIHHLECHP
jgi:hypothetical protein